MQTIRRYQKELEKVLFERYNSQTKMSRFSMHRLVEIGDEEMELSDSFYEEVRKNHEDNLKTKGMYDEE